MRVITGTAKGRVLETLSGDDVRPTTAKIKESVFSMIQFQIQGRNFLDLFAGSGQMGIEALSRGAASATFVETRRQAVATVKKNLQTTKLSENAQVFNMDSISFLSMKKGEYDIAFLDPPYKTGLLQKAMELLPSLMKKSGVIVCENPMEEELPEQFSDFLLDRQYRYGTIRISTYRHKDFI